MSENPVNVVLAVILVIASATSVGVWCHPQALVWLSDRLYARAKAVEAARAAYRAAWLEALRERSV